MATPTPTPTISNPLILCLLINSLALPPPDLFSLSQTNKSLFRLVFIERKRHLIRTVPLPPLDKAGDEPDDDTGPAGSDVGVESAVDDADPVVDDTSSSSGSGSGSGNGGGNGDGSVLDGGVDTSSESSAPQRSPPGSEEGEDDDDSDDDSDGDDGNPEVDDDDIDAEDREGGGDDDAYYSPFMRNPLICAMDADYPAALALALELGDFEGDGKESPVAQGLVVEGGVVQGLIARCVERSAGKCLKFLLKAVDRVDRDGTVMEGLGGYNAEWVWRRARRMALVRGRLEGLMCVWDHLVALWERRLIQGKEVAELPEAEGLFESLLEQARSPAAVVWLVERLPKRMDMLPVLIAQCSNRFSQPMAVEAVVDLVGDGKKLSERWAYGWGDESAEGTTALEAAVEEKNLPAVHILLRNGARPGLKRENARVEEGWEGMVDTLDGGSDSDVNSDIISLYAEQEEGFTVPEDFEGWV
ncbi:hypothetical protein C8A05DRAFT_37947 [Staphylotrichum tortipilum]|uniref:F-box domain-containing protein n=1 Tax=Staphylotrichum tortipilum TaxID=2831512 RepID=A0AAN6RQI2_9PEZI|nr:hypothetical protein C8A05DRAFT_37947 [Staphylotrichum longicolle]